MIKVITVHVIKLYCVFKEYHQKLWPIPCKVPWTIYPLLRSSIFRNSINNKIIVNTLKLSLFKTIVCALQFFNVNECLTTLVKTEHGAGTQLDHLTAYANLDGRVTSAFMVITVNMSCYIQFKRILIY